MRRAILGCTLVALISAGIAGADRPRHLDEAIAAQERLAQSRPANARALNDLGNLLTLAGELERAEEVYRGALEIAPDDPMIHYNLGLLLRLDGRSRGAIRHLKQAVKLDGQDAWSHFQLALLLEEQNKSSDAVRHFTDAFVIEPALTELEINPQLLDSRLVPRALTAAYTERSKSLELAPRRYRQPHRITGLLVPETQREPRPEPPDDE